LFSAKAALPDKVTEATKMNNPSHPVWSLLRLLIFMAALVVTLWMNATSFDATEIRTIITMFVVASGAEWAPQVMQSIRGKSD
jgi:hypothetical protein